ncbi:MXAN_6640 family putative metalloprotease, partial [Nocardioides sp.]|uniref:MXAN_6640 family putative metalloprotease n=1 Tax=Nocardioides sp. TaxID=35761 RepID=UPI002736E224
MRRSLTSRLAMLAPVLALALLPASAGFASGPTAPPTGNPATDVVADTPAAERATEALEAAEALFAGQGAQAKKHSPDDGHDHGDDYHADRGDGFDRSATLVLDELVATYDDLDAAQRLQADAIMARPTDSSSTQSSRSSAQAAWVKKCTTQFCVHYENSGQHVATDTYTNSVVSVMSQVWTQQITQMGYRAPLPDGSEGGDSRFDIYLQNILPNGLLGYCQAEVSMVRKNRTAPTFCVLDNDYAETPNPNGYLRLTAAHEFFHAVQNAYDAGEDPWMKEASATWMEERFATDVNDNRFFLPQGQVKRPLRPLDSTKDQTVYGNWPFFEFISSRYGNGMVKRIWTKAAGPSNKSMSVKAIDRALGKKGGLAKNYARFASVNTAPWTQYAEGGQWGVKAPITKSATVKKSKRVRNFSTKLKHLTSRNYNVRIKHRGLQGKKWKLGVRVVGPRRASGPGAHLLIH